MAKIPLPERGQPIDVSYIYQITNAVNQLSDQVNSAGFNYTTVEVPGIGKQNIKTSESRIIAATILVSNNPQQGVGTVKDFTYSYNGNFKYPPVATATIVNNNVSGSTGNAGDNAIVTLTDINTNSLSGFVRFNTGGNVNTSVNLIIVGIPN
jgi:hypothetical protein